MLQTVEKSTHIRVHDPVDPLRPTLLPKLGECLVRAVPGPKAMREGVKVLLVYCSQHHGHGTLHDLVFKRGQSDGALTSIGLDEPLPLHRRGVIPPAAQPLVQVPQVLVQVRGILRCRYPVDPRRAIFARPAVRLAQEVYIHQVHQRRKDHRWISLCLLRNPLELRCEGW